MSLSDPSLFFLYVISDLHLGLPRAGSLELLSKAGMQRLADFITRLAGRPEVEQSQLVLNGDIVDFLTLPNAEPFIADDAKAHARLSEIIQENLPVFTALQLFVKKGGRLSMLIGNHDVELSLPAPRRLLLETIGPGRVEFVYDNEGLVVGPVLMVHGNEFDAWNDIDHPALRRFRAKLSRGSKEKFVPPPGSKLVVEVLNGLVERHDFTQTTKPENAVMGLLLLGLSVNDGILWSELGSFLLLLEEMLARKGAMAERISASRRSRPQRMPLDDQELDELDAALWKLLDGSFPDLERAASDAPAPQPRRRRSRAAVTEKMSSAPAAPSRPAPALAWLKALMRVMGVKVVQRGSRTRYAQEVAKALDDLMDSYQFAWSPAEEKREYLEGAQKMLRGSCRVVICGHTHLPKFIRYPQKSPDEPSRFYLNTGTWADLVRMMSNLPTEPTERRLALHAKLHLIFDRKSHLLREQLPIFARIRLRRKDSLPEQPPALELDGEDAVALLEYGDDFPDGRPYGAAALAGAASKP